MQWLLTPDQMSKHNLYHHETYGDVTVSVIDTDSPSLCKAQLSDTYKKLMEPCTEHLLPTPKLSDEEKKYKTYTTNGYYASHRKDCPACIESLKQEAGIE